MVQILKNQDQINAAKTAMSEWLLHPQELGKKPAKIECAGVAVEGESLKIEFPD